MTKVKIFIRLSYSDERFSSLQLLALQRVVIHKGMRMKTVILPRGEPQHELLHYFVHNSLRLQLTVALLAWLLHQQRLPHNESCAYRPILVLNQLHVVVGVGCVIAEGLADIANDELKQHFTEKVKVVC